jgi:hypothetical protein
MPIAEQLCFPSIAFPKERKVLVVAEVAAQWEISEQHVIDLLEDGKLDGFDISGNRKEFIRIPAAAVDALAEKLQISRDTVLNIIDSTKPKRKTGRAYWRVPVEGYNRFISENRS